MKALSKNPKLIVLLFYLFSQIFILTSCKSKENVEPQNTITLKYKGQLLEYKNVDIYKGSWISKKGIIASGKIDYSPENNSIYSRVNILLQEEPNGQYSLYMVEFGSAPISASNVGFTMYKADLTKESDRATFQTTIIQNGNKLTGEFSGKVKVLVNSEIEISEGKYSLFLSTVKGN